MFLFLYLISLFSKATAQNSSSIISLGSSLHPSNNPYWSSDSGHFAFGFYPEGDGFVIAIWLLTIHQKTVIWTANPDNPVLSKNATLTFDSDGLSVLQDGQQISIANAPQPASSASMLNSGNFVLYDSDLIIWQTFGVPTDTILPRQRLLSGKELVSSISNLNRTSGKFGLRMRNNGNLVMYSLDYPFESDYFYWRSKTASAGDNVSLNLDANGQLYLLNPNGIKIMTFNKNNISGKAMYRATVDADGIFRLYSHNLDQFSNWSKEWESSKNKCDPTGICGQNSYCSIVNQNPACSCLPSFDYIDTSQMNLGCQWKSTADGCPGMESLNFSINELENISWKPDSPYSILPSRAKDECRDECSRDCNCEAAVYRNEQCRKLKFPLKFGKVQRNGKATTFIKTSSGQSGLKIGGNTRKKEIQTGVLITCIVISSFAFIGISTFGILFYRFRLWNYKKISSQGNDELLEEVILQSFTYEQMKTATNNFKDEIGRGGFGAVYKGFMSNGTRIVAVKKLPKVVAEGEREFLNEMKIIGRTHHKSLVRLLGYCHDETNRLLVYEYMKNGSLADFLFRRERKPDWEKRIEIALNIARGMVYLHEECETQIIHCDIKPENILMDENEWPKIADFGLSKLLMPDQSMTYTGIRGTRGYVAPEWHGNLPITVKVDVYSYGIMLLEILCCRRNVDMDVPDDEVVLANWVYQCLEAKELNKLIRDEVVEESEVERMVRVGVWCIQNEPSSRPSMKKVVLMLEGVIDIPEPPAPPSSFGTS